jgi:hypothetical protein
MSENTALTELANFVGRSPLTTADLSARNRVLAGMSGRLLGKKRSVGDLLGVVLVLSARARRMAQPEVGIDIDVFAPGGKRALRLTIGSR